MYNKVEGLPVKAGDSVLILGYPYHYKANSGAITIEITGAKLIKVNGIDSTYTLVEENTSTATHLGTIDDPLDEADAILLASKLDAQTKEMSQEKYYIVGVIVSEPTSDYCNFNLSDGNNVILSYGLSSDEAFTMRYGSKREISELPVQMGDKVLLYGYLQNYSGKLEIVKAQLVEILSE